MTQQNTSLNMYNSINLKNQTFLGSLVQVLAKLDEKKDTLTYEDTLKTIGPQIKAEIEKSHYGLENFLVGRPLRQSYFSTMAAATHPATLTADATPEELAHNKDHTLFYFMSHSNALDFLYQDSAFQLLLSNPDNFPVIFKTNGAGKLKETSHFNTNHALNAALIKNNKKFIANFAPLYLSHATPEQWKESVKIALNYGNQTFLNLLEPAQIEFVKNLKNAHGRNASYYVRNFSMLDYMADKFEVVPPNPSDWFEKNLYHIIDLLNSYNPSQKLDSIEKNLLTLVQEAKERQVNIEYYVKKPQKKELRSPPLWILLAQMPQLLPQVVSQLRPETTDSVGSNFIFYIFNTFKKQAPDTAKSLEQEAIIEELIHKNFFNLDLKNEAGVSALDILQETVKKETKMPSVRLENYKKFCEKIIYAHEIYKITQLNKISPKASTVSKPRSLKI